MKARVETVTDAAGLAACHAIRREVFVTEQHVPENEEWDDKDGEATHFLLMVDGEAWGTARLRILGEMAKIERVALRNIARGQGLGAMLMRHVIGIAKTYPHVTYAKLGGQANAIAFYQRLGFEICSESYMESGILHHDMKLAF